MPVFGRSVSLRMRHVRLELDSAWVWRQRNSEPKSTWKAGDLRAGRREAPRSPSDTPVADPATTQRHQ